MLGVDIMSIIPGGSKFWFITISNPFPIETTKKTWGIIPISVAKKKFTTFTLNKVGNMHESCHGIPPTIL